MQHEKETLGGPRGPKRQHLRAVEDEIGKERVVTTTAHLESILLQQLNNPIRIHRAFIGAHEAGASADPIDDGTGNVSSIRIDEKELAAVSKNPPGLLKSIYGRRKMMKHLGEPRGVETRGSKRKDFDRRLDRPSSRDLDVFPADGPRRFRHTPSKVPQRNVHPDGQAFSLLLKVGSMSPVSTAKVEKTEPPDLIEVNQGHGPIESARSQTFQPALQAGGAEFLKPECSGIVEGPFMVPSNPAASSVGRA